SAAINQALSAARGKYVALFTGDDLCHPDRLRLQLGEYARGEPRVLFSACEFIDDDGRPLDGRHFASTVFDLEARSRAEKLHRLFYHGNYFNGVTVFTERDILTDEPYDPGLLQLQDYDVWVRLIKRFDLQLMEQPLVRYRVRGNGGNLSSPKRDQILRIKNEYYLVLRRFFDGLPAELFRDAFRDELIVPDFADGPEYDCEQAFALCRSEMPFAKLIGIERLHRLLCEPATASVLAGRYAFTNANFFRLLGTVNVTDLFDGGYSTLFPDTGEGWDAEARVTQQVSPTIPAFDLEFALTAVCRPRALRWDPVELQTGRVRIDAIDLHDSAGKSRSVDLATVESNGDRLADGRVAFPTADPYFWWPVAGEVAHVRIRGRWETDEALKTILAQSRHVAELTRELEESRRQLRRYRRLAAPFLAMKNMARRLRAG
ncbi:MAG TPA: glycosyltransferase, partial [Gemmataceae bacterium]|nr:glycosyltransferase [Gemmataceae bacterium]